MNISYTELARQMSQQADGRWGLTIPAGWMQGRTTYGGLSAALCYLAIERQFADLPPLRSAQINFIGPAGGAVQISSEILRQGRSVSYIEARMQGEKGLATHGVFCFGASRESKMDQIFTDFPDLPSPDESSSFFRDGFEPSFTQNFEIRLALGGRPVSGSPHSEHFMWVRHRDTNSTDTSALIAVADMPPPAVLPMFTEPAPISSMTWMMNFIQTEPTTENGWWLLRSAAEHAADGYSSQDMTIWNSSGELILTGRQSIAIFY
ncbi:MAG: thioesterase family protein [Gammaproteobacteria bacterium]|nr:thioesterase family protein [Gammaproteobacteria bacterium]